MGQSTRLRDARHDLPRRPEPLRRYADFNPDIDEVAAYGVGALIAGKVAAKAGLFKGLIALLLASKKLLVIAGIALFAAIKGLLGRKQEA